MSNKRSKNFSVNRFQRSLIHIVVFALSGKDLYVHQDLLKRMRTESMTFN